MKRKMNNKGFSLVELIVVMAIMAILAVTLAPRLTHYVEKARKSSDQEVINTILSTSVLSLADESIKADFALVDDSSNNINLSLDTDSADTNNSFYITSDGKTWSVNPSNSLSNKLFFNEISTVVGNFKLKSTNAGSNTVIIINYNSTTDVVTVTLDYDGLSNNNIATYSISSR